MSKLQSLLTKKSHILADGAIGTLLYQKGVYAKRSFEESNLTKPKLVEEIHKEYIKAGSDFITTNTFGANPINLTWYGLSDKAKDINLEGVKMAKDIAKDKDVLVAGSIGPLIIDTVCPYGKRAKDEAIKNFALHANLLEKGGVDFFILETFAYLHELLLAIETISKESSLDIVAQLTLKDGISPYLGESTQRFTTKLDESNAHVIGINCGIGATQAAVSVKLMKKYTKKDIIAQPNTGLPKVFDNRFIHFDTPQDFAVHAKNLIVSGAKIIGGCCGTTPSHIREMKAYIKSLLTLNETLNETKNKKIDLKVSNIKTNKPVNDIPKHEIIAGKDKSLLANKLHNGKFITTVELTPPKGPNTKKTIEKANYLKSKGIDAINIPDGPRASSRLSALLVSLIIEQNTGMETIMHYTCRDRNILGMQSDLLGAYASGLHNVLIVTGDPPKMGDYPEATPVFDLDAIGLTKIVTNLNKGFDIGSNPMSKPTAYFKGVGVNPGAYDIEYEIDKFHKKIDAGAEFAITQPIFNTKLLINFLDKLKKLNIKIPIIAGVWPLVSYRNALFMQNEVPGVFVSKDIMEKMYIASNKSKEEGRQQGIIIANDTIKTIKDKVAGIQVSAPFGNVEYAILVLEDILP